MTNLKERKKHKEAALKAWETIRREKREKAAKSTAKITSFISPETIEKIKHPEAIGLRAEQEVPWRGNRIVMPFDKTPKTGVETALH